MASRELQLTIAPVLRDQGVEMRTPSTGDLTARRDFLVEQGRSRPVERLAAFLLFLSRDNVHNGLDGSLIADDLRCGLVAELLHFSLAELERWLVALNGLGLVRPTASGALQLTDIGLLEQIADGRVDAIQSSAAVAIRDAPLPSMQMTGNF